MRRILHGARRGITHAKNSVRGLPGQCRGNFRKLIVAKIKTAGYNF
jgi:hypothetical protein